MATWTGTLYLVGTPIGNLEDITLRALRVLKEVDVVAAEDTRVSRRLLTRHGIETPLISYHQHSEPRRLNQIIGMLTEGKQVALVSDAGMPGVSDPGVRLVQACVHAGLPVLVVPGPTASSAALALSGLGAKEFFFLGFLPSRPSERRKTLGRAGQQPAAIVCFEAPHRMRQALKDIRAALGDREAVCARELTKRFEQVVRGRVSHLIAHFAEQEPRGEMTLVVAGAPPVRPEADVQAAVKEVRELVEAGLSQSRAVAHVAKHRTIPRRELYRAALRGGEER